MNEDDHIKQFLRFTSEDELIRLAEIGLAVEMHQAAQRFFHGRVASAPRAYRGRRARVAGHCLGVRETLSPSVRKT
jgi:hypothetical protein